MNAARYKLSFTTGGLFIQESTSLIELYLNSKDWLYVENAVKSGNLLQVKTASASKRVAYEIISRLKCLSLDELALFMNGNFKEKAYILWSASTRRYELIKDFAIEVLRDHYVTLKYQVRYEDFDVFYNNKAVWHEELDQITESTRLKLRNNIFRMMKEAQLITADNFIQPATFTPSLISNFTEKDNALLLVFPISDADISKFFK